MHAVIIDNLEEYLSGHLPPSALDRFQAHLETCGECRREVDEIQESSGLLASLKPDGACDSASKLRGASDAKRRGTARADRTGIPSAISHLGGAWCSLLC